MNKQSIGYLLTNNSNNFNILRLLAACLVIYGHTSAVTGTGPADIFLQFVGFKFIGGVAVDIFFVISGFFITSSALNASTLRSYVGARILRIYPALIVCVVLLVFILGPIFTIADDYWSNPGTWNYLFVNGTATNVVYYLPGVFQDLHDKAVNGSLWSLAVELKLYIAVFILSGLKIIYQKSLFNILFFLALIIGYFDNSIFISVLEHPNHVDVAMMFLIGSFMCINKDDIIINAPIALVLIFIAAMQHNTPSFGMAYNILLPYLVFYIAFIPRLNFFNKMGDYSYGVYLYGWPSQQLIYYSNPSVSNHIQSILALALALALGVLSWHIIENNANKLKRYLPKNSIPGLINQKNGLS